MAGTIVKALKLNRSVPAVPKCIPVFSTFFAAGKNLRPSHILSPIGLAGMSSQSQEKESGKGSKLLLFLPGVITFGLGTWQIFRRQEKVKMLDYRKGRLEMEPLSWNDIGSLGHNLDSLEFRKIICEGMFDEGKSIFVGPRSRSISGVIENGYYIVSPFIPKDGVPGSYRFLLIEDGYP